MESLWNIFNNNLDLLIIGVIAGFVMWLLICSRKFFWIRVIFAMVFALFFVIVYSWIKFIGQFF